MIQPSPRVARILAVTVCTVLQLCFGTVYAWSFFQTLLVRQSGWTFTETAWAFSLAIFSLGVSAAWAGQVLPRIGPRKLALAGSFLFCSGYVIAGLALQLDHVPLFCLGYGVVGGIGIGMGYVTPVATVAKWFPDKKGLATGIVVMGFGVGALLLSKGLAPVLVVQAAGDLPLVFFGLAAVFAVILFPASLLMSNPPPAPAVAAASPPPSEADAAHYLAVVLPGGCLVARGLPFGGLYPAGIPRPGDEAVFAGSRGRPVQDKATQSEPVG